MMRCNHMFVTKGRFYDRQPQSGSDLFTVFQVKQCAHCEKTERKVESKKKIIGSPDVYERQLVFSGIKPASRVN